ncbi:MAG: asparagine--tRNA ligase, partial [Spirochaetaceae bacterium]|nr:asparagine--tRNA ligase [Spirochaetaceae bacterium]
MKTTLIKDILGLPAEGQTVELSGWVRTKRESKNILFLAVNDGSCMASIQLTFDRALPGGGETEESLTGVLTGAAVRARGRLVPSPAQGQAVEVALQGIDVLGEAPQDYPLQKKNHSLEFLREVAHLRARTNTFGAVARVRSQMAFGIHSFFQSQGFQYFSAPIITASDCEGAGEMFQVTTLDLEKIRGKADYGADFFGKRAFLTVSGQLAGETYATALSRIYTFGPTFRAENSNTTRHIAEFWMIEPEMAFYDLEDNSGLAESLIKYLLNWALEKCGDDMKFFDERIKPGNMETLSRVAASGFERVTYTDAVKELEKHSGVFEFKPFWGCDLQ